VSIQIGVIVNGCGRNEDVYSRQIQLVSNSRYSQPHICDVVNGTLP